MMYFTEPDAPKSVQASIDIDGIKVGWYLASSDNGHITSYHVSTIDTGEEKNGGIFLIMISVVQYLITRLHFD